MKLTIEQNKKLAELYPYLIPRNVWTGEIVANYDFSYLEDWQVPGGWNRLFFLYCKNLRPYLVASGQLHTYRFSQLKEKYGTLRIYDFGCPESASHLATLYESYSKYVCEHCGQLAKYETSGWISYCCKSCVQNINSKVYPIHKKSAVSIRCYAKGQIYNIKYTYKHLKKEYKTVMNMTDEEFYNYLISV